MYLYLVCLHICIGIQNKKLRKIYIFLQCMQHLMPWLWRLSAPILGLNLWKGEFRLYKTCRNPALSWTGLGNAFSCAISTFYLWHWMQKVCVVRAAGKGGPVCCINALLVDTSSSLRMNPWPGTPVTSGYQKCRPGIAHNCGDFLDYHEHGECTDIGRSGQWEIKRRGIFPWAALSLAPPRAG